MVQNVVAMNLAMTLRAAVAPAWMRDTPPSHAPRRRLPAAAAARADLGPRSKCGAETAIRCHHMAPRSCDILTQPNTRLPHANRGPRAAQSATRNPRPGSAAAPLAPTAPAAYTRLAARQPRGHSARLSPPRRAGARPLGAARPRAPALRPNSTKARRICSAAARPRKNEQPAPMGRLYTEYLEGRIYCCSGCQQHVAQQSKLVSRCGAGAGRSNTGRACVSASWGPRAARYRWARAAGPRRSSDRDRL